MEELSILLHVAECDLQEIESNIDSFTRHNRSPSRDERKKQFDLFLKWNDMNQQLSILKDLQRSIISNAK